MTIPSVVKLQDFFSSKSGSAPDDLPLLHWSFPIAAVLTYMVGKFAFIWLCKRLGTTGDSGPFRAFVVAHNIALCLYSAWTAFWTWSFVINSYSTRGFLSTYCDHDLTMWHSGMDVVYWLFYLSKVWEFVDTAILIIKQKPVSMLQFYHHCGALLTMWGLVVSRASSIVVFVSLNSVIHTIMYAYFTCSALKISFPMNRSTITQMQLAQFFIGWAFGTPILFAMVGMNSFGRSDWIPKCTTEAGAVATVFGIAYLFPLVALFINFYISNYINPPRKGGVSKKTE